MGRCTCTSVKQKWHEKNSKRGRVHQPSQISKINFDRPHPERDANYSKRKRWDFDPRPVYHCESNLVIPGIIKSHSNLKRLFECVFQWKCSISFGGWGH